MLLEFKLDFNVILIVVVPLRGGGGVTFYVDFGLGFAELGQDNFNVTYDFFNIPVLFFLPWINSIL